MPVLLLVGAGHAHLHVVKRAAQLVRVGYEVRLLAPRFFDYSGVATAASVGELPGDTGRIDVRALAHASGVAFHEGTLISLDVDRQTAVASDGVEHRYDVLALNIGSVVAPDGMEIHPDVVRVKPLSGLADLDTRLKGFDDHAAVVTVVGSGASGLELAAHLSVRPEVARVHLIESAPQVGAELPKRARSRVGRLLASRSVVVRTECAVVDVGESHLTCADGTQVAHDLAVVAVGLSAPPLIADIGLGDAKGVPVRATLQHRDRDEIYAAGDCAHFLPGLLPRVGVHGVRQGPILHESLLARLADEPLPEYEPQRAFLAILDLGDGVALAVRGRWWWFGSVALRLKRFIDRRWLANYRT